MKAVYGSAAQFLATAIFEASVLLIGELDFDNWLVDVDGKSVSPVFGVAIVEPEQPVTSERAVEKRTLFIINLCIKPL